MKKLEEYARRAGEEFFASNRAETPGDRAHHRARALTFVALRDEQMRLLRKRE